MCIAVGLLLAATSSEAFFKSLVDNQCIATPANTAEMGVEPHTWECLPDELGQQFRYVGKHICNNHCPARCLAVPMNLKTIGQTLTLWENLDTEEGQQWTPHPTAENYWVNGHGLCLERVSKAGSADVLQQHKCDFNNKAQRFQIVY